MNLQNCQTFGGTVLLCNSILEAHYIFYKSQKETKLNTKGKVKQ